MCLYIDTLSCLYYVQATSLTLTIWRELRVGTNMANEESSIMMRGEGDVESKSMMKGTEEEDADVAETEDLKGLPIDGGWAYVVMIGE